MPGATSPIDLRTRGPTLLANLPAWVFFAALAMGVVAVLATCLELLAAGHYLPSTDWLRYSQATAYVLLSVWFCLICLATARASKHRDANAYVDGVFVAMLLVGFLGIPFANFIHRTIPALLDGFSVNETEHSYTIHDARGRNDKWCRSPVDLVEMPPMIRLCDVTFRAGLDRGDPVTFGGFGSWRGLYVDHVVQP